ncbi:hypothetical protein EIP91_011100 [Steccherinum ochraceum]|uniref:Uncharacterized protein n=1 Tax=Steccherinum ochraceum TaxID=92696 RepID=A0A4R0RYJ1_9APHY|nr:hypothetical protein EIP91_011100 [Steccherinum ochraceum]
MATLPTPNSRASLLSGLRTGGVRSASGPMGHVPHTAAPSGTFNVSRRPSVAYNGQLYATEEEDELADMVSQSLYINNNANRMHQPMTSAVDGSANRFAQQQYSGMNASAPMSPFMGNPNQAQLQALQLQMMQVEIARLQALQAQQYQAEMMAQAQRQRVPQQPLRRSTVGFVPPATAGPAQGSFDLRTAAAMNSQMRRAHQADQLRSKLGLSGEEQLPMTAALNGKYGMRSGFTGYDSEEDEFSSNMRNTPATPNYTTVISGGTSLGNLASNTGNTTAPSKSDAAVSWRRGNTNHSVLKNRTSSAPLVKVTPPPSERVSPPPMTSPLKTRPQPLTFTAATSEPLTSTVVVSDGTDGDDSSSTSSRSGSSPSTPRSASSIGEMPPLSPREEASKKLYEGLGIGRPAPAVTVVAPTPAVQRLVSQPVRQPRGPPSNNDELTPKNFATRSRRQAIGALLDAAERREVVEAY